MLVVFRALWAGWNRFVRGLVAAQSRVLMLVTWIVGVAPVAVAMKLAGRRMLDRAPADPAAPSYRSARDARPIDMERASRMF